MVVSYWRIPKCSSCTACVAFSGIFINGKFTMVDQDNSRNDIGLSAP